MPTHAQGRKKIKIKIANNGLVKYPNKRLYIIQAKTPNYEGAHKHQMFSWYVSISRKGTD